MNKPSISKQSWHLIIFICLFTISTGAFAETANKISQYGITWTFDKDYTVGRFVNGDWWVIGPVAVVSVTPMPTEGPLEGEVDLKEAVQEAAKGITGFRHFVACWLPPEVAESGGDKRMRNGSMVMDQFGTKQGYDSRSKTYDPNCSVSFPYQLAPNRTLISAISQANPASGVNPCHNILWRSEKGQRTLLRSAAVLTCLASEPPADAFRPPYAGTEKPIYQVSNLRWELLLNLKLENLDGYFQQPWLNPADRTCEAATWEDFEGYFQRPWLGHYSYDGFNQVLSYMQPGENQPGSASACFGREDARVVSIASLMMHLDVPKERKGKLLIGLVQRGIDLSGLLKLGGGHCAWLQSGCKWPILFASLMLDKPELRQFPEPLPFHEDIATYYGTGWCGQTALWRIVMHGCLIDSGEERAPEKRTQNDTISEMYRNYGSSGRAYAGTALAARLMNAVKIWGHDAFFDYCDRWMDEDDPYAAARGANKRPEFETKTWDPFVTAMWHAYRKRVPEQEISGKNFKAVWEHKKEDGWHVQWVTNPIPDPKEVAEHVAECRKASSPTKSPTP